MLTLVVCLISGNSLCHVPRPLGIPGDDNSRVAFAGDIVIGHTQKHRVDIPSLFTDFPAIPQARLAIVGYKHVGEVLERRCVHHVFCCHSLQHLGVVERRVIGGTFFQAPYDVLRRVNVECIYIPGNFRNLVPTFLFDRSG